MPVPLAQSRPFPGQAAQCYAPSSSACLQEWRFFRQCLPPFDICHGKDFVFLVPNEDSSDVSCVHCWLFYHQAPVRRVWFHLFCTLPWGAADNGGILPKSSFSLSWTNPVFSLSCFITFSSPSPSWCLSTGLSLACESLLYWAGHLWMPFTRYRFPSARERGIITLLPLLTQLLLIPVLCGRPLHWQGALIRSNGL